MLPVSSSCLLRVLIKHLESFSTFRSYPFLSFSLAVVSSATLSVEDQSALQIFGFPQDGALFADDFTPWANHDRHKTVETSNSGLLT